VTSFMPRIKDLKRFLKRNDRFKVIPKDYYEKRWYGYNTEVLVFKRSNGTVDVSILRGLLSGNEEHEFSSLDEAVEFIKGRFPPEYYVYYKPRWREDESFINVRSLFGFTVGEAEAWKLILARAMGHLNDRKLLGVRVLKDTSRKCDRCYENTAAIQLVFEYGFKRYSVYYCRECFRKRVLSLWAGLLKEVGRIKDNLLQLIEQPVSKEELREIEEAALAEDEDYHYLKELGVVQ